MYDIIQNIDGPESIVYGKSVEVESTCINNDGAVESITVVRGGSKAMYIKWYETSQESSSAAYEELSGLVIKKKKLF